MNKDKKKEIIPDIMFDIMKGPGKGGFIAVPRRLMEQVINEKCGHRMNCYEAYLYLIFRAGYADCEDRNLKRGEFFCSLRGLSQVFGWCFRRTKMFIGTLELHGIVTIRRVKRGYVILMRYYDEMCMQQQKKERVSKRDAVAERLFDEFWKLYHDIVPVPPVDVYMARKVWMKMTDGERKMAIDNIEGYYYSLRLVKYARSAYNYLLNKSYIICIAYEESGE